MSDSPSYFRKKVRLAQLVGRQLPRAGLGSCLRVLKNRDVGYAALELREQLPKTADVIVDVGAHRGVVSEALHFLLRPSRLIAVEPGVQHHLPLKERLSHCKGCELEERALAEAPGELIFHSHEFDAASSLFTCKPGHLEEFGFSGKSHAVTVQVTTLERLMAERKIEQIDLLKLDCQGAELRVLKGAGDQICKVRAIFAEVSFETVYEGAPLFPEVHAWLSERGFTLTSLNNFAGAHARTQWGDALYVRRD